MHIVDSKFDDVEPMAPQYIAEHTRQKVDKMYFIASAEGAKRTPATTPEPLAPNRQSFVGHRDC